METVENQEVVETGLEVAVAVEEVNHPTGKEVTSGSNEEMIAGIENQLEAFAGLGGSPELEAELSRLKGEKQAEVIQEVSEEIDTPGGVIKEVLDDKGEKEAEIAKSEEEKAKEVSKIAEQEKQDDIESPIFGGKLEVKKKDKVEIIDTSKEVSDYITKNFGLESFDKFTESAKTWRKDSQQLAEHRTKTEGYENIFKEMPSTLYAAIKTHFNGGDWRQDVLDAKNVDYDKDLDSISTKDIVEAFSPSEISEDQWEDFEDGDLDDSTTKLIKILEKNARNEFAIKKESISGARANAIEKAETEKLQFSKELNSSVSHLKDTLPEVSTAYMKSVESKILGGGIKNLFFDKKGQLRPEAALRFTMAQDGFDLMEQWKRVAGNKAKSDANLEVLERTASTPPRASGGVDTNVSNKEQAQDMIDAEIRRLTS